MARYLFIFLLFSNASFAQIYKWVDNEGKVHFTDQPRKGSEAVDVKANISTKKQTDTSAIEINKRIKSTNKTLASDRKKKERKGKSHQARSQNKKQIDQKNCQYYKDKLANTEYRWKLTKTQGYKQSQKNRYLAKKDKYQRDVKRHCR